MVELKYPECDCTVPPDTTRFFNCGHKYDAVTAKVPAKSNGNGITVSCVGYATKCKVQANIYIRASVASAPTSIAY